MWWIKSSVHYGTNILTVIITWVISRLADEVVIDLLFGTCGETYETLTPYSETIDLDGILVRTLNLEGLLKTKQSMRDKDTLDRLVLEKALEALLR